MNNILKPGTLVEWHYKGINNSDYSYCLLIEQRGGHYWNIYDLEARSTFTYCASTKFVVAR